MKGWILFTILISGILLGSCFDAPELPIEPNISLENFYFKDAPEEGLDSLIVELKFEDGDGDLGLTSFDTLPPYNELYFYVDDDGNYYRFGDDPSIMPPYNCRDYEDILYNNNGTMDIDTFWVERNPDHYNYYLDILYKNEQGEFVVFDFVDSLCTSNFYGRFFPLNTTNKTRPLEGILRYGVQSGFQYLFPNKTIKLRIQIQDRALHKSNVIETVEYYFEV